MSKPTPKSNFMQTALLMVTIYLGFTLIFNNKNQQTDVSTVDQIYARLVDQNANVRDLDVVSTVSEYNRKLDDEVAKKKMAKAVADEKKTDVPVSLWLSR